MMKAPDERTYSCFLFILGVTIARELTRCFASLILGRKTDDRSLNTPWIFENYVLCGVLRRYKRGTGDRKDQTSIFLLRVCQDIEAVYITPISMDCIYDFVKGEKSKSIYTFQFVPLALQLFSNAPIVQCQACANTAVCD